MKKIISVLFLFCSIVCAYSQEKTALQVVNLALKEDSPNDAVILIQNEIKNITVLAEKRSLFAFLGSLQETLSMFEFGFSGVQALSRSLWKFEPTNEP